MPSTAFGIYSEGSLCGKKLNFRPFAPRALYTMNGGLDKVTDQTIPVQMKVKVFH